MNVLVTGSLGFIGGHLSEELLNKGYTVIGLDNMCSGLESTKNELKKYKNYIDIRMDIRSKELCRVFDNYHPEVVFHLAAIPGVVTSVLDPIETNDVNVGGTVNLLKNSSQNGVKKFIFSSSSSVYGGGEKLPTKEDDKLLPNSPYALQKKIGEEYCKLYSHKYNLDTVCLRYFNIFGPRQRADSPYAAAIASFCQAIKENKRPKIYGDGNQFRDFTYVKNIVQANMLAGFCEHNFNGEIFNIGCGEKRTLKELIKTLGCNEPIFESERPGDVKGSQADISKAINILKYSPKLDFKSQLQDTLKWYINL